LKTKGCKHKHGWTDEQKERYRILAIKREHKKILQNGNKV